MSAITTGMIVGAIATAGGSIGAAAIGAHAAGEAADTQDKAAQRALAFQKEQYDQQRRDWEPYAALSQQAMSQLGQPRTSTPFDPRGYTGGAPTGSFVPPSGSSSFTPNTTAFGMPAQSLGGLGGMNRPPQAPPPDYQQGPGMQSVQPPPANQLRRVQAPTGEIAMLPDAQAQLAVSRGARILA